MRLWLTCLLLLSLVAACAAPAIEPTPPATATPTAVVKAATPTPTTQVKTVTPVSLPEGAASPFWQFATFLTNHDQERAMSELRENVHPAKTATSLLLTGLGVPFLYYGEEIGHIGGKPDDNIRTPMQWSDADNAGSTTATIAWQAPQRSYRDVNVAAQTDDPDTLLSHYRRLILTRNAHAALRIGDWWEVEVEDKRIYAFVRRSLTSLRQPIAEVGERTVTVLIDLVRGETLSPAQALLKPRLIVRDSTALSAQSMSLGLGVA